MIKYILRCILLMTLSLQVFADAFEAGKDYVVLSSQASKTITDSPVEITEFFSYGCPWCYRLEAEINKWAEGMGDQVTLEKVPVVFNPAWEYYAKAYYIAKALGISTKLSPALFHAIIEEKVPLNSNQALIDFFIKHGVDKDIVQSAFEHSTSIDMEVANSKKAMATYHIAAVPAFVVNGQYKTDLQMAQSKARLLDILTFLVQRVQS